MKNWLFFIITLFFACEPGEGPRLPSEISEFNPPNLQTKILVNAESEKNIFVTILYKNISTNDTFMLYKKLLPYRGEITEDIFAIFSTDSLTNVKYTNRKSDLKYYQYWDIKPESGPSWYIQLLPGKEISFETNLAEKYDFTPLLKKGERVFAITPNVNMPLVNTHFQHVFMIDTLDYVSKPVYYFVGTKENTDVDSMRVAFKIP